MGAISIRYALTLWTIVGSASFCSGQVTWMQSNDPVAVAALKSLTEWLVQLDQQEAASILMSEDSSGFFFYKTGDAVKIHTRGLDATVAYSGLVVDFSFRTYGMTRQKGMPLELGEVKEIVHKALRNHQNESWRLSIEEKKSQAAGKFEFVGRFELKKYPGVFRTRTSAITIKFDIENRRLSDFRASAPPPLVTEPIGKLKNENELWESALDAYVASGPLPAASSGAKGIVYRSIHFSSAMTWLSATHELKARANLPGVYYEARFGQPSNSMVIQTTIWIDAGTGEPVATSSISLDPGLMTSLNVQVPTFSFAATGTPIRVWIGPKRSVRVLLQTADKRFFPATYVTKTGKLISDWGGYHEWQATDSQIWEILKLLRAK